MNLRDIFGDKPSIETWTYQCKQGTVRLRFARDIPLDTPEARKAVGGTSVQVKTPGDPAVAKLSDEIGDLEKQYQAAVDASLVTPEAIDKLSQAFDKQRELVRIYPTAGLDQSTRLMRLDTELSTARAKVTGTACYSALPRTLRSSGVRRRSFTPW